MITSDVTILKKCIFSTIIKRKTKLSQQLQKKRKEKKEKTQKGGQWRHQTCSLMGIVMGIVYREHEVMIGFRQEAFKTCLKNHINVR